MSFSVTYKQLLISALLSWPVLASAQPGQPSAETAAAAPPAATAAPVQVGSDYHVNPGDVLIISVWKEPDLQGDVLVRPDGKFSFPLAGDIMAKGRSIDEIRVALTQKLAKYIPDLVVSVSAVQINGNKVYVLGQVNRPGEFVANPSIDIMQAIAVAGGTTPFADLNDIRVLRRDNGILRAIDFNYGAVAKGKRLEQNIVLQAGDVVVVP